MNQYLDSDSLRRQANTVVRLTVVTTLGLIATVSTGFLGMNLFDETSHPAWVKLLIFLVVLIPSTLLVNYAVAHSKVLSDFLEALADQRRPGGTGFRSCLEFGGNLAQKGSSRERQTQRCPPGPRPVAQPPQAGGGAFPSWEAEDFFRRFDCATRANAALFKFYSGE